MIVRASYHHGDLQQTLLDAGEGLLDERGLQGFTLRECARRAGVSHAAPKHHFGDVRGFLSAIAGRGFARLAAALRSELQSCGDDLVEQFYATTHAYVGFAEEWPEHFRVMFRSDLLHAESPLLLLSARATFLQLTNVVLRQRGDAEFGPDNYSSEAFSDSLIGDIVIAWSHVHGYAHLKLEGQLEMIDDDVQEQVIRTAAIRLSALLSKQELD